MTKLFLIIHFWEKCNLFSFALVLFFIYWILTHLNIQYSWNIVETFVKLLKFLWWILQIYEFGISDRRGRISLAPKDHLLSRHKPWLISHEIIFSVFLNVIEASLLNVSNCFVSHFEIRFVNIRQNNLFKRLINLHLFSIIFWNQFDRRINIIN